MCRSSGTIAPADYQLFDYLIKAMRLGSEATFRELFDELRERRHLTGRQREALTIWDRYYSPSCQSKS